MDPALYEAAMEGNIDVLRQHRDRLCHQLTPRNNTVLHVAAQFQDNRECVNEMLILEPSLLRQVNSNGETALHIAARRGRSVTVEELLAFAKKQPDLESGVAVTKALLRMATLEEKDTALHEAVRNNHLGVVELLLEEDPDLSNAAANSAGETPLYLAAERNYDEIVSAILGGTCRYQAYGGPNGRTALHAAVIAGCSGCVEKLLDKNQDLIKIGDSYGWMPLHFAARFGLVAITKLLLNTDASIAYLATNDDDKMTALHLAAQFGTFDYIMKKNCSHIMEELCLRCPDCWEMVNERGENVLHIAIKNSSYDPIGFLLKSPSLRDPIGFLLKSPFLINLLNGKDKDGNTPFHVLVTSKVYITELITHPAIDKGAFNKKNQTPRDVIFMFDDSYFKKEYVKELNKANAPRGWRNIYSDDEDRLRKPEHSFQETQEKETEKYWKVKDTTILVAALIATVTFAASFTVPGGFDSNQGPNQGMAVLVRHAAFKTFAISNTIAVTFSISALIFLLFSSYYELRNTWFDKVVKRLQWGVNCLFVSLAAMMVSFIAGSFAVLATSMGLALAVCTIGCVGLLIFCVSFYQFRRDILTDIVAFREILVAFFDSQFPINNKCKDFWKIKESALGM